jgi:hypothetical protein
MNILTLHIPYAESGSPELKTTESTGTFMKEYFTNNTQIGFIFGIRVQKESGLSQRKIENSLYK